MITPTINTTKNNKQANDPQEDLVAAEPIAEITCDKCETTDSWEGGSWCPVCGYYPLGGKFIHIGVMGEEALTNQGDEPENFWQAVPRWGWELFAGVIVIAAVSLTVTLSQEAGSSLRSWWAVIQAALGAMAFFVAHFRVFFLAIIHSERFSPISWLVEPIQIWKPIFKKAFEYQWYIRLSIWGQTAALLALVLVGGLNYAGLFKDDWGIKGVANMELVGAIEDAEEDTENQVEKKLSKKTAKKTESLYSADCVVIGFTRDNEGNFRELLIASTTDSQLQYVGRLKASDLPPQELQEINRLLKKIPLREKPVVKTVYNGIWLKPQMMLKVGYDKLTATSRFKKIKFQSLLREEK
ncbi:hypothetical protein MNBD_PLANCTO02-3095 [hydrothermal vent metagenome]|uniref:DNA ligase ATP-dependent C-terminal domain-containing protein n=1 Tax=hydrothermal vent metagenome TaxID=652676 RepID=A0A3B1DIN3_9ZZZZ